MTPVAPVAHVHVVVPARDEAEHLGDLLDSLAEAASRVPLPVTATLVLDSCTDTSAEVAAGHPGVEVVEVVHGVVGEVRRAGVARAPGHLDPRTVWVACTDADSRVPADWLEVHLEAARDGVDLLLGTVRPDPVSVAPRVLDRWVERHHLGEGHPHVHGANLGIRLSAYDLVGGFEPLATGEDVRLAARVQDAGLPWRATDRAPVITSGRRSARAPAGFAGYVRTLEADLANELIRPRGSRV